MKRFISDEPEQTGSGLSPRDDNSFYTMLLALARSNCFDDTGCIIVNGEAIPDTSVSKLVAQACKPEKRLKGSKEFVTMLQQIGITEIPNENLLAGSSVVYRSPPPLVDPPLQMPTVSAPLPPVPMDGVTVPLPERAPSEPVKRKSESSLTQPRPKKARPVPTWQLRQRK